METEMNVVALVAASIAAVVVGVVALVGLRSKRTTPPELKARLLDGTRNQGEAAVRMALPTGDQLAAYSLWEWEGGQVKQPGEADSRSIRPADGLVAARR